MPRATPLGVAGVLAWDDPARALARRLAERPDARVRLAGVALDRGIVLVGDGAAIPWVDGVTWLGRDPDAPALLIPTLRALVPHPALVLEALRQRVGDPHGSFVLAERGDTAHVIPLASARAPGGEELASWTV